MIFIGHSVSFFTIQVSDVYIKVALILDYNELVKKAFKTIQKGKTLDPKATVAKESLLRFMCEFSE